MPDWNEPIRQQLAELNLAPAREAEIVEELAQHAEDRYRELLSGGATEAEARRATLDDAVSIRGVKRFMVDQEVTIQLPEVHDNAVNAHRKVAIIGAGPAGLSCAYFLARLGYMPKVFEGEPRPGGMMAQTIPSYRLPREILAREIRMIERMGV